MPRTKFKKKTSASDIYQKQNRLLHRVFSFLGYPYHDEREYWLPVFSEILGKEVTGLSSLTLRERDGIIREFRKRYPEADIHAPWVPAGVIGDWKKGGKKMEVGTAGQLRSLRRVIAETALDLRNREQRLRGLCRKHAGVDDIRWCTDVKVLKQVLTALRRIAAMERKAKNAG